MMLLLRAVAALLLLAAPAFAQTWPDKQVRIVVPFPAGGSADILCRLVGEKLSAAWGQTVIIDNRAGAGGNVGAEVVYRAEPDGYTLLCSPPGPLSINHNLYKTLPYDWSKFFGHRRAGPGAQRHHRARRPAGQDSLKEFIAYAKANPGKATYASQGNGSTSHLSASMLATLAGIGLVHVPTRARGPPWSISPPDASTSSSATSPPRCASRRTNRRGSWDWPAAHAAPSLRTCQPPPNSVFPTWYRAWSPWWRRPARRTRSYRR